MKSALLVLTAFLAITAATAPAVPASAGDIKAALGTHRLQPTDISAAHRYRGHHYTHRYYAHRYYARPRVYAAPVYGWSGSAVDAGSRPGSLLSFYRRNNICAIDEGYGRATRCD